MAIATAANGPAVLRHDQASITRQPNTYTGQAHPLPWQGVGGSYPPT